MYSMQILFHICNRRIANCPRLSPTDQVTNYGGRGAEEREEVQNSITGANYRNMNASIHSSLLSFLKEKEIGFSVMLPVYLGVRVSASELLDRLP